MKTEQYFICGLFAFLISIVIGISTVSFNDNATMERMVKGGASPIQASCAINDISATTREMCITAASVNQHEAQG